MVETCASRSARLSGDASWTGDGIGIGDMHMPGMPAADGNEKGAMKYMPLLKAEGTGEDAMGGTDIRGWGRAGGKSRQDGMCGCGSKIQSVPTAITREKCRSFGI